MSHLRRGGGCLPYPKRLRPMSAKQPPDQNQHANPCKEEPEERQFSESKFREFFVTRGILNASGRGSHFLF